MKPLLLIFCFSLLSISANSNIPTLINNNHTGITQNNRVEKKQSFKDFLKSVEKIKGHKLNWREKMKLRFAHIMLQKSAPKSRNKLLLTVVLIFLMLIAIALAALIVYWIIQIIISFTGGVAAISTPSG